MRGYQVCTNCTADTSPLLFLSTVYPEGHNDLLTASKVKPDPMGNVSNNFISGFEFNLNRNISVLNIPPVSSYPLYHRMLCIPGFAWQRGESSDNYSVGFINLYGIRQYSRKYALARHTLDVLARGDECRYIVASNMSQHNIYAVFKAKQRYPQLHSCVIVPDLPWQMVAEPSPVYTVLKSIDTKMQLKLLDSVDSFVLFSESMAKALDIENKPHITIEGMVDSSRFLPPSVPVEKNKVIMYSGGIEILYGIDKLLSAFSLIDGNEYKLYITGSGSATDVVRKWSDYDNRVKYLGVMPYSEMLELQRRASVLVNPRYAQEAAFPSKTIEYLASGTPVLVFKTSVIPDEYDDYLHYFTSTNEQDMANQMKLLCQMPESQRLRAGNNAQGFLRMHKDYRIQTRKILSLIRYKE